MTRPWRARWPGCVIFMSNDAFATAHRAQASTHGVAKYAPLAAAGPLLIKELEALGRALQAPARPLVAVVGGAKVSTKLTVLQNLLPRVDHIIVGGGIANTFLKAAGHEIGRSLHEADLVAQAKKLLHEAGAAGCEIPLPVDAVCARAFAADAEATSKPLNQISAEDMIMDAGPETAARLGAILASAKTIVWNGPLGVFEFDPFSRGTEKLARAIAASNGLLHRRRRRHHRRPSRSLMSARKSPISAPAAAPSLNFSKAENCRPLPSWKKPPGGGLPRQRPKGRNL